VVNKYPPHRRLESRSVNRAFSNVGYLTTPSLSRPRGEDDRMFNGQITLGVMKSSR
jgi:hypothetical protein